MDSTKITNTTTNEASGKATELNDRNNQLVQTPSAAIEDGNSSTATKTLKKITHFFPVLRPNIKAKMGSVVRKQELSNITKPKTLPAVPVPVQSSTVVSNSSTSLSASTVPNKSETPKVDFSKNPLLHMSNKKTSEILSSALNMCISEVLRRNIEANSRREAENNNQMSHLAKDFTNKPSSILVKDSNSSSLGLPLSSSSQVDQGGSVQKEQTSKLNENITPTEEVVKAHKPETSPAIHGEKTTDVNKSKKKSSSLRHQFNVLESTEITPPPCSVELLPRELLTAEASSAIGIINEIIDNINNAKNFSPDPVKYSPINDFSTLTQKDKMSRSKKGKKRHFKGATYSLYLTPARKKKKLSLKQCTDNSKDDAMSMTSTENGSCVDSSDACSMFSDDFNTSEKSLADDEPGSNSRSSPLLALTDQKIDFPDFRNDSSVEKNNACRTTNNSPVIIKPELSLPDSDGSIKTAKKLNKLSATKQPPVVDDNDPENHNIISDIVNSSSSTEVEIESGMNQTMESKQFTTAINVQKNVPDFETVCNPVRSASRVNKDKKKGSKCKSKPFKDSSTLKVYTFPCKKNNEGKFVLSENSSKTIPLSTIATSVKSRQRIKRRFTDDIIDTDIGILSLNSMHTSCRKAKAVHLPPPKTQDIIESYDVCMKTLARGSPLSKVESVYSGKQQPVNICACRGNTYEVKIGVTPTNFYCQAVDTFNDKLVGCSSAVYTFRLVRASVRTPFTVMCEMHLWRLQQHHSCPRCGVFCSQGRFVKCTAEKGDHRSVHLYHEHCTDEKKNKGCLHCGLDIELEIAVLDCEMISPPAFFQSQHSLILPTKARMCVTVYGGEDSSTTDSDLKKTLKLGTDVILSASGLSSDEDIAQMENLLSTFKIDEFQVINHPITELYYAARDGDEKRVLHMLATAANPNEKFPIYDNNTALHVSSISGNALITHLLLQSGAVSDCMNRNLRTPLMLATENNNESVAELLVKMKAPINTKGEVGMTCLHIASRDGHIKLCKLFLDSGRAHVNALDDGGWTPIVWASEHGHEDIVKLLINRGGNPNIRDNEGNTALHWAAFCGTTAVCVLLLNYGCNIDETNEHGDTPLHIAARQDNYGCVDLFLSRSACVDVINKVNELPGDCCSSYCKSAKAISVCVALKEVFKKSHHKCESILTNDIALGRERYPIRCVNAVDDDVIDESTFLYITDNCETCPIKMDRNINSLQHCRCSGDCVLPSCTCSAVSFKCWYDIDGRLVPEFNMFDPPLLFECNRACACDISVCRNRVVQKGMSCRLELMRTNGRGWGVRALKTIPRGSFICEYVGELITDSEADTRRDDSYLFDLDNKDGETYCLDARHFGNISRFINHLCEPNLIPVKVFIDHQDLSFPRIAFFSLREIRQYEELGFDYGEKFWVIKSKSFTCNCSSGKCKYSRENIKETLENYNSRMREEGLDEIDVPEL